MNCKRSLIALAIGIAAGIAVASRVSAASPSADVRVSDNNLAAYVNAASSSTQHSPQTDTPVSHLADFENFNEGDFFYPEFTDPRSGIHFINSTGPDPGEWVIEYTGSYAGLPTVSPGHYLSSVGYAPGPAWSLPHNFGFTGILPEPANSIGLTLLYQHLSIDPGTPTIRLEGFDAHDELVASTDLVLTSSVIAEQRLQIDSLSDMSWFKVTPQNIFSSYDNISFTPEPSAILLGCAVAILRRWRTQGSDVRIRW
jgi:hypothetical protein